jgi:superkiller protein 3
VVVLVLLSAFAVEANAQMGGVDPNPGDPGTGGRNIIQGSIFLPGGRRIDRRVKVKLIGLVGGDQFRMSDDSGAFAFRRLQGGRYTVVVDAGSEFEIASESVDIIDPAGRRSDPGQTQTVYITLQPRKTGTGGTVGTVDANLANVPEAALGLYKQAMESVKNGDRKKAIEQLNQAIQIHPTFAVALNELGVHHIALKQPDKALESLKAALTISPDFFHARLNSGIALLLMKDYKTAAVELEKAVQKNQTSAVAHLHFGRALAYLGNYQYAEAALKKSIEIGGDASVEAHRYLAAVYNETQRGGMAADELETYLRLSPKARDADRIRGIIKDLRRTEDRR